MPAPLSAEKMEAKGDSVSDLLQFTASSTSSFVVHVHAHTQYLHQWRSITSIRFVCNMVCNQLRCSSPLFHNFKWFIIKATTAHHAVIKKEKDELLAKGAIEPLTGTIREV